MTASGVSVSASHARAAVRPLSVVTDGEDACPPVVEEIIGYPAPAVADRAAVRTDPAPVAGAAPLIWAMSAHGGGGAASLASRVGFIADCGHQFPSGQYPGENYLIICAAETVVGLQRAHRLVLQHMNHLGGDTTLLAVVTHPVNPAWVGKKTPAPIRERLGLLEDPNLPSTVLRLAFDADLATTYPEDRHALTPQDVHAWLTSEDKDRRRPRRGALAAEHALTDTAATLLQLVVEAKASTDSSPTRK